VDQSSSLIFENSTFEGLNLLGQSNSVVNNSNNPLAYVNARDSANLAIDDCSIGYIGMVDSPKIRLNNSDVETFDVALPYGFTSRISNLNNGYIEDFAFYINQELLAFNISKSSIQRIDADSAGSMILEDSKISELTIPAHGTAVILNSNILTLTCGEDSYVVLWNSNANIMSTVPSATIKYASSVNPILFYVTVGICVALAIILTIAIIMLRWNRQDPRKNPEATIAKS
jgi:hypothetical protein